MKALKATRPLEYICLVPVGIPTQKDGTIYTFIAVDAFSKYVIVAGDEKENSHKTILKNIKSLLGHTDFIRQRKKVKSFTLVLDSYLELAEEITEIIQPFGGSVIFDESYITEIVDPVIEDLFSTVNRKK